MLLNPRVGSQVQAWYRKENDMQCPNEGCDHEVKTDDFRLEIVAYEMFVNYHCPECDCITGLGFDEEDLKAGLA